MPVVTFKIAAGADDRRWFPLNASPANIADSSTFDIGDNTVALLRMTGATLPQGSTINRAVMRLKKNTTESKQVTWTWYGYDVDTADANTGDLSALARTTATAAVSDNVNEADNTWRNIVVTSIVQEIVDRAGFSETAVGMLAVGASGGSANKIFDEYEDDSAGAAELIVVYDEVTVTASEDDAFQASTPTTSITAASANTDADTEYQGFRFAPAIPQGATINSAHVHAHITSFANYEPLGTWWGDDSDDAAAFATSPTTNISGRTATTATVAWDTSATTEQQYHLVQTPDLATIVQELVDRAGWDESSHAVLIFRGSTGSRDCGLYHWDTSSGLYAPILVVDWDAGGATPVEFAAAVTVGASAAATVGARHLISATTTSAAVVAATVGARHLISAATTAGASVAAVVRSATLFSAATASTATVAATVKSTPRFTPVIASATTVSATVGARHLISAAATSGVTVAASLVTTPRFAPVVAGDAVVSAALITTPLLTPVVASDVVVAAAISTPAGADPAILTGAEIVSGTVVDATVGARHLISATVASDATVSASLVTTPLMAASATSDATVGAALITTPRLTAAILSDVAVSAALVTTPLLAATVTAGAVVTADVTSPGTAILNGAAIVSGAVISATVGASPAFTATITSGATVGASLLTTPLFTPAVVSGAVVAAALRTTPLFTPIVESVQATAINLHSMPLLAAGVSSAAVIDALLTSPALLGPAAVQADGSVAAAVVTIVPVEFTATVVSTATVVASVTIWRVRIVDAFGRDDHILAVAGADAHIISVPGSTSQVILVRGSDTHIQNAAGSDEHIIRVTGARDVAEKTAITLYKGGDHIIRVTMTTVGSIAGETYVATIRDTANTYPAVAVATCAISTTGDGSTAGVIDCTLTDTQMDAVPAGRYEYDVWRSNEGSEYPLAFGDVAVIALPSRA